MESSRGRASLAKPRPGGQIDAMTAKPANIPVKGSILMLTPDRRIDRRITLSCESLELAGWKTAILAMPADEQSLYDPPNVERISVDAGSASGVGFVAGAYRLVRSALPMNGALMRWSKAVAWRFLVDPDSYYWRLFKRDLAGRHPDIVVANDLPMLPVAARLAGQTGAKLIYDSHELYCEQDFPEPQKRIWRQVEAKYICRCNAVITINGSIARELEQRYSLAKAHVVLNAERTRQSPERSRYFHERFKLTPDALVLLFQGGIIGGRQLETLVRAFTEVEDRRINLVFLGDGVLAGRLQRLARAAGIAGRVHFHPAVAQDRLLALSAAADGGVVPYQANCLNNHYCTPNKLFEFIAAGVPIVASDLPEIRNIVAGYHIGMVGDTSSPESLARLIDQFFADQKRRREWRSNLAKARRELSWEREGAKLVSIYEAFR